MNVVFHSNFAAYILFWHYKPCEFLGFVCTDCWGNANCVIVITSPANWDINLPFYAWHCSGCFAGRRRAAYMTDSLISLPYTVKNNYSIWSRKGMLCKKSKILLEMEWKITTSSKSSISSKTLLFLQSDPLFYSIFLTVYVLPILGIWCLNLNCSMNFYAIGALV